MAAVNDFTKLQYQVAISPVKAIPLDGRIAFATKAAAVEAAQSAKDIGSSESNYYYGQKLLVIEDNVIAWYTIQADNTLKEDGSTLAADNKSIEIGNDTISMRNFGKQYYAQKSDIIVDNSAGTYTTSNFPETTVEKYVKIGEQWYRYDVASSTWVTSATEPREHYFVLTEGWKAGLEPKVAMEGDQFVLAWYEPSSTTVEGLSSQVQSLTTSIDNVNKTIAEHGAAITTAQSDIGTLKTDVQALKDKHVVSTVEKSDTNGNVKVDGTDVEVYTLPAASTTVLGGVKPDGTSIKVDEQGNISVDLVSADKIDGLDTKLTTAKTEAVNEAKTYADDTFLKSADVVASADVAADPTTASDTKAISEKAFVEGMTWVEGM